jgi:KUP system potassium uptake protein
MSVKKLVLAAIGVVYGDIGTSPLYAVRECFHAPKKPDAESWTHLHVYQADWANVNGVLSLVFWSLVLVVSVKYLMWILRMPG